MIPRRDDHASSDPLTMIPRLPLTATVDPLYAEFLGEVTAGGFSGVVSTDYSTRLVASTDNSVYQIVPQAVLFPRTREDVIGIGRAAGQDRFRKVRLVPRGGGTGTTGASLGAGICVDLSRFMHRIVDFDAAAGLVRVEPGVVLDQVNDFLRPHGVFFAPHVAPSDRATLGGMISNDACGQGSRLYGRTSRHVESLDLVLCDGSSWSSRWLPATYSPGDHLPERIEAARSTVGEILRDHAGLIKERFPDRDRFLTGYDLAHASRDGGIDVAALVSGSEGTLAFVVEATLRVTPIPAHKRLVVAMYGSFDDALTAAHRLLESEPSAIETIDGTVLGLARQDVVWHDLEARFDFACGDSVAAINLIELCDSESDRLRDRILTLIDAAVSSGAIRVEAIDNAAEARAFWALRNRGVGLLGNMAGARRPVPFVEDCAVPPLRLAEFVADFRELLDRHGLVYGMYGHVDVGCLHVRPALDLRDPADGRMLRSISDAVFALVQSYGGVFWGEHGKGMRSGYSREVFGPVLYHQIRRIKEAFDPYDQMNPGKVAAPARGVDSLASIDAAKRGDRDREIAPLAQAKYETAIACNGNGACFSWDVDRPMCPSMKVTGDRVHSPKGRATLMREWLRQLSLRGWNGDEPPAPTPFSELLDPRRWLRRRSSRDDFSHEVFDAFAGCLSCKACVAHCPVHVDIPEFKAEFLQAYHRRYARPISDHLVAAMESTLPRLPPRLCNSLTRYVGGLLSGLVGLVDPPQLAPRCAEALLSERGAELVDWSWRSRGRADRQVVALVPDAFTNFLDPQPFVAMYEILRARGVSVVVLPYRPSGKSHHVKGFLREFGEIGEAHAADLFQVAESGVDLICVEPAIALLFRQEYARFASRGAVSLPQEWLAANPIPRIRPADDRTYVLLSHCTEATTAAPSNEVWKSLFESLGMKLEIPPVGCCGMAGAYGHEASHLEESQRIFDQSWRRRIEAVDPRSILATGYSCRSQVARFAGFSPRHPLEILCARLGPRVQPGGEPPGDGGIEKS